MTLLFTNGFEMRQTKWKQKLSKKIIMGMWAREEFMPSGAEVVSDPDIIKQIDLIDDIDAVDADG